MHSQVSGVSTFHADLIDCIEPQMDWRLPDRTTHVAIEGVLLADGANKTAYPVNMTHLSPSLTVLLASQEKALPFQGCLCTVSWLL